MTTDALREGDELGKLLGRLANPDFDTDAEFVGRMRRLMRGDEFAFRKLPASWFERLLGIAAIAEHRRAVAPVVDLSGILR